MPTLDFDASKHPWWSWENVNGAMGRYTGPSSYVTGGDPADPNDFKLGTLFDVFFGLAVDSSGTVRLLHYDSVNDTIRWVVPDTGNEVAGSTDLSDFTAPFLAIQG
jgi:hypothetical protein